MLAPLGAPPGTPLAPFGTSLAIGRLCELSVRQTAVAEPADGSFAARNGSPQSPNSAKSRKSKLVVVVVVVLVVVVVVVVGLPHSCLHAKPAWNDRGQAGIRPLLLNLSSPSVISDPRRVAF